MAKGKVTTMILSKSRVMRGLQCTKSLHLTLKQPELEAEPDAAQQALFARGHEVGELARAEFPSGVLIDLPYFESEKAAEETKKQISQGRNTIFEATFLQEGLLARVDILLRKDSSSPWEIIEVKSSTMVKPEHITDVGFQKLVLEMAGLSVSKASVMYINRNAVAPDLRNFFVNEDVTQKVTAGRPELERNVALLKTIALNDQVPSVDIGPHCEAPYECPFKIHCWKHIPENSIFEFPRIGEKAWSFYKQGIVSISDPKFGPFKDTQAKRLAAIRTGERWLNLEAIRAGVSSWRWPLFYLDFETINFAIPKYPGTRPYQQVPFQFSVLRQDFPGGPVTSIDYLHDSDCDPRPMLAEKLVAALQGASNIVAYNMGFEAGCLEALADFQHDLREPLDFAREHLVDPLPIFRAAVYDPAFKGSFSIKTVAPALLGESRSYNEMEVSDGDAAQQAFLELISPETSPERRDHLRIAMLAYCQKDTKEMFDLVEWLLQVISGKKSKAIGG